MLEAIIKWRLKSGIQAVMGLVWFDG